MTVAPPRGGNGHRLNKRAAVKSTPQPRRFALWAEPRLGSRRGGSQHPVKEGVDRGVDSPRRWQSRRAIAWSRPGTTSSVSGQRCAAATAALVPGGNTGSCLLLTSKIDPGKPASDRIVGKPSLADGPAADRDRSYDPRPQAAALPRARPRRRGRTRRPPTGEPGSDQRPGRSGHVRRVVAAPVEDGDVIIARARCRSAMGSIWQMSPSAYAPSR